ncbi:hypothetical protein FRX31_029124 [Thalictrum thalictroides]|uniref:Uncharacterized protein n=1 Tax=Thalictrum thalictroides TaxID=46969 RepID=A0A7J6V836_THATH|nr:hypothetical protein FRX31_029124 [Thalictrum thalictroides]
MLTSLPDIIFGAESAMDASSSAPNLKHGNSADDDEDCADNDNEREGTTAEFMNFVDRILTSVITLLEDIRNVKNLTISNVLIEDLVRADLSASIPKFSNVINLRFNAMFSDSASH